MKLRPSPLIALLLAAFLPASFAIGDGNVQQNAISNASSHDASTQASFHGAELLLPYKKQLQTALKTGLSQGPIEAIAACQLQAPAIASSLSTEDVKLGRSSERLRNPENKAPEWLAPILTSWSSNPASAKAISFDIDEQTEGYVEPIFLKAVCETCHGATLAEPLAMKLKELYPEDKATGFKAGDFRGVFWVQFPKQGL